VVLGSKLLSSIWKSGIYSFLKYLYATERDRQAGNIENIQPRFRSPRHDPFFDPLRPLFGSWPILWEPQACIEDADRPAYGMLDCFKNSSRASREPSVEACTKTPRSFSLILFNAPVISACASLCDDIKVRINDRSRGESNFRAKTKEINATSWLVWRWVDNRLELISNCRFVFSRNYQQNKNFLVTLETSPVFK